MKITFVPNGWEDYVYWQTTDRKILKKINQLIDDITRDDPFTGIGKPEPLRHHLSGAWSRRINDEHRLVYLVSDDNLVILSARYHYDP
ncbi:Txe/YoeB family addiction module toxin [Actinobacteria bacterium YIM 96077]|uniref:Toxin YoeB n=1 Tax=Phytoactinopolyspora halophila TaxID=1981511 RepID=A0A329QYD1_9ACTN|nr:Txe/YoeB family addiction module toxin [Phytoactinopolyspora halophila]AYY13375.1 Txe/YoeB family addiction module toxin [Actinobacteria bacterium YIM 96077]RAW17390.1 Txe/YoeB family addiction module toxin [Phytoactinopolyspora halophila]